MKISGSAQMAATPDQVWAAVHDPAVLARCIPGCQSLRELSTGRYAMTVMAGVAAIKGSYAGEVAIHDVTEPTAFTMKAEGAGAPGTIATTVEVALAPGESGGTSISYEADAIVGGAIGGVGQRMLAGVARKMAGQMFTALDRDIAGERPAEALPAAVGAGVGVAAGAVPAAGGGQATYAGSAGPGGLPGSLVGGSSKDFGFGVLVGGALTLVGVVLGWAIGGRR
ncbi:SRPBCC family protein [Knoellia aerolata]|uniref:Carbon monoxide dehydrogenase subunit G n=1 Tax=Knoellia aerolata DSM 18566 TaxID=1385519 RepID=A0A0A0K3S2_9MICO|nr:carbon monoxide dehydrogenase subunit G [Knoellia aerolata]KGN42421.1 carbon monoxide dehydrogenase subunit G [Knoellia aerolata DSM 18566]